jgi:hypothetical protein
MDTDANTPVAPATEAKTPMPLKAFTVLEEYENTGGIIFAKHAVTARRIGAGEYADGDFSLVSCRRAKWADKYADTGIVPASEMVWHGWHFECGFCGRRIDDDRPPYRKWTPDFVVGNGNGGAVYCDKACCTADKHEHEFAERLKARTVAHYAKRLGKRFPGITVKPIGAGFRGSHVYVDGGRIKQIVIDFDWPGQKIGPAAFRWDDRNPLTNGLTCCFGDKEAFEAFARSAEITRLKGAAA